MVSRHKIAGWRATSNSSVNLPGGGVGKDNRAIGIFQGVSEISVLPEGGCTSAKGKLPDDAQD